MHKMNNTNKKSFIPIIIIVSLLLISIITFSYIHNWYNKNISIKTLIKTDENTKFGIKILSLNGKYLLIKNENDYSIKYNSIKIEDRDCNISGILPSNTIINISLGDCLLELNYNTYEVVLFTEYGIFSDIKYLHNPNLAE